MERNDDCQKCRYADCSPTVWPCRVCVRIHKFQDYFVPADPDEIERIMEQKKGDNQ